MLGLLDSIWSDVRLVICDRVSFTHFLHWATLPGNTHVHINKVTAEAEVQMFV